MIDTNHALAKLGRQIDWRFLEERFGAVFSDKPGQPPLPTRLMAGLAILKHMHDLSDEALCERWLENPYFKCFAAKSVSSTIRPSTARRWRAGGGVWARRNSRR
jgi:IS5 family transposase